MRKTKRMIKMTYCAGLLVGLALGGCATLSGARGGGGTADTKQLTDRNQALAQLEIEAFKPCSTKGKPQDNGVLVVTARADGSVSAGAVQWYGSDELKTCMMEAISKTRMPEWKGPQVTWLWPVGTKETPAPKPLDEPPASYRPKMQELVMKAQGNTGMGSDTSIGELSACAQRSFSNEAYALVRIKLFVFPDGKVVGATPVSNEGEGREATYMDCVAEMTKGWNFDTFQGPGFTTLDVDLKFGVNPSEK